MTVSTSSWGKWVDAAGGDIDGGLGGGEREREAGKQHTLRAFWGPPRDDVLSLEYAPSRALSVAGIVKGGWHGREGDQGRNQLGKARSPDFVWLMSLGSCP